MGNCVSTPFPYLNDEHFAEYAEAGIGAFELSVDAPDFERLDLNDISRIAEKNGIDRWSFYLPFYFLDNVVISVPDEESRKKCVAFHGESIRRAADAGFKHIVLHPSSEPIHDSERTSQLVAAKRSIEEIAVICEREGVVLAVENLPRTCLANTAKELLDLIDGIDGVGICFDVNHLLAEDQIYFLEAVADKLVTVHLSDYDRINERHWLPGEGIIDWTALIKGFERVGYNGPLMYEINRGGDKTIARDAVLTPSDFARNANEIVNGLPITKLGRVLV